MAPKRLEERLRVEVSKRTLRAVREKIQRLPGIDEAMRELSENMEKILR